MEGDTIKIAICDDDTQEILLIHKLVDEYSKSNSTKCKIDVCTFGSGMELIAQIESGKHFDVFLLDVIMPIMNGIELATKIRNMDQVAKIIFLTSSPEFAVDSYSVDAFFYSLKPIQEDKLFSVLDKACVDNFNDFKNYILIKTQSLLLKVFFHELVYVEVIGRNLCFHKKNGALIECTGKISEVEADLLFDKRFIKPHRSYIVNLDFIQSLSAEGFTTTNGRYVPVSRKVYREVKQAYFDHSFNR